MQSPASTKPKILVVDDEQDNLDLLSRLFRKEYKILQAVSGPTALEILASEADVSIIVSDHRMPVMNGMELLKQAAIQSPQAVRIMLSGYIDEIDVVQALEIGQVFKFVRKPWDVEELKMVLRQALEHHELLKSDTDY